MTSHKRHGVLNHREFDYYSTVFFWQAVQDDHNRNVSSAYFVYFEENTPWLLDSPKRPIIRKMMHMSLIFHITWHVMRQNNCQITATFDFVCSKSVKPVYTLHDDVIKWNIIRGISPWWGESIDHRLIPITKANDAELWCCLVCAPEQTEDLPVIWDAMLPMWLHCNGFQKFNDFPFYSCVQKWFPKLLTSQDVLLTARTKNIVSPWNINLDHVWGQLSHTTVTRSHLKQSSASNFPRTSRTNSKANLPVHRIYCQNEVLSSSTITELWQLTY